MSEICAEGIFVPFPWWLKNVKSRSKIALFSNERYFEIWFPKKRTITFSWSKLSKLHKKDQILHVATTFSLKQGETRTSHGPIPHPLTYVKWCPPTTMAFQSFLSCIAVCTSGVSSPVSCFRTSTYVKGSLPGFLICFGIQWINLDTGSFLFLKQWPTKRPLLSPIFCECFGRSPWSSLLVICCFHWMLYIVLSILV